MFRFGSILFLAMSFHADAVELLMRIAEKPIVGDTVLFTRYQLTQGMFVVAKPDGWSWGRLEGPPKYAIIKLPSVSISFVNRYLALDMVQVGLEADGITPHYECDRSRQWRLRYEDLPALLRTKLETVGSLTISATGDRTWPVFRDYLTNIRYGTNETINLP